MSSRASRIWSAPVSPEWKITVVAGTDGEAAAAARPDALDDRALVRAAMDGSREAFDVLVERHRRAVYRLCFRFVGRHEDASDLAQDVFVRAWRGLPRFKGQASLATWLHRIGVNVCLNRVTMKMPVTEAIDPARHADGASADPAETVVRGEQRERVRAAIARLPPRQRSVLILRVYQELPHAEIARILGSSVGAVKANFFHALTNLKRLMQEP